MFDPLDHPGLPVERHGRHWHELDVEPIDVLGSNPGSPGRISTMEALESAAALFDRRLAPRCPDADSRASVGRLGESASARRRQVAALQPAPGSALEGAIGAERAAYDLVAWVARSDMTPDRATAYRRQAFRHLERLRSYAELGDRIGYGWAGRIGSEVDGLSSDADQPPDPRRPGPRDDAADRSVSLLYDWAVRAVRQQIARRSRGMARQLPVTGTVDELLPRGNRPAGGQVWWERLVVHDSATCYLYYSFLGEETEPRLRPVWELHLQMALAHLRAAGDLLRRHTGQDPHEVVGAGLPEPEAWDAYRSHLRVAPASAEANGEQSLIDLLTDQHGQIGRLFQRVLRDEGDDRHATFGELMRLIALHEVVEEMTVHPLARRLEPDEHRTDQLLDEERRVSDALEDVVRAGGDGEITALRDMVIGHARREEREEFRAVRRAVPADELRELAQTVRRAVADDAGRPTLRQTVEHVRDKLSGL